MIPCGDMPWPVLGRLSAYAREANDITRCSSFFVLYTANRLPDLNSEGRLKGGVAPPYSLYMTQSGKRRIFRCRECGKNFSEIRETVFFDLRTPEEKVIEIMVTVY